MLGSIGTSAGAVAAINMLNNHYPSEYSGWVLIVFIVCIVLGLIGGCIMMRWL